MTGWITANLASGPAHKAQGHMLAALTNVLFLPNHRRAGERAEPPPERLQALAKASEIECQILGAADRSPADRDALADRLRKGHFRYAGSLPACGRV